MSLQVWLPLNENLNNQGISGVTVTNLNATTNANGKIGSCYYFNGTSARIACSSQVWDYPLSICGWFKPSDVTNSTTQYWISYNTATGGTAGHAIGLGTYSGKFNIWYGGTQYYSFSQTLSNDVWYHITVTITSDKRVTTYLNGQQIDSRTFTSSNPGSSWFTVGARSNSSTGGVGGASYYYKGYANDVRLYDHCLSPLEVKEISQGLVLHYKLNGLSGGAGDNLVVNYVYNGTVSYYSTTLSAQVYENDSTVPSNHCVKMTIGTASGTGGPYFVGTTTLGNTGTQISNLITDAWYTVSYWIKSDKIHSSAITTTAEFLKNVTFIQRPTINNYWQQVIFKGQYNGNTTSAIAITIYEGSKWTAGEVCYVSSLKVEQGTTPTPWSPALVNTSIDTTKVVDCSGYGNNGTLNNIIYTSDSPRYFISGSFNGTNSYVKVNDNTWMAQACPALTVNMWAKATTWPTNGGRLISCTESGGFNLEAGNSGYWRFPIHVYTAADLSATAYKYDSKEIQISALTADAWNMITLVYDSTGSRTYINGNLHHTYTNTSYGIHFNTNARLFLGCEANTASPSSPYFSGQMSDVRIYMTALSADDIKALYNTSMSIDNLGQMHSFEFSENDGKSIGKNGISYTSQISELDILSKLKYDPNIYIESDGSAWVHIYHHNNPAAGSFAASDPFATSVYKDENRWFNATEICNALDKWEFLIKYAYTNTTAESKQRWIQTVNPELAVFGDVDATDITRITGSEYVTGSWGGLYKKAASAYWVMNNGNSGNWWGATGSYSIYQGGIPGYGGTVTTSGYNDLYVRIDNVTLSTLPNASVKENGTFLGNQFIEK